MYRPGAELPLAETGVTDRRDAGQPLDRRVGRLIACDGARATIATMADETMVNADTWVVGRLVSINTQDSRIVGFVFDTSSNSQMWQAGGTNIVHVHVELVGEVRDMPDGSLRFSRGITRYPPLGSIAHRIRARDLAAVYDQGQRGFEIGRITQDDAIAATISVDDLLSQHFAILGTTGVGKSSAAAMLVRAAIEKRPNLRVVMLDPHNEYAHAFAGRAHVIDASRFDFPCWMLTFEELSEVVFRGRDCADERDALRDAVIGARGRYRAASHGSQSQLLRKPLDPVQSYSADTPLPYRMADVLKLLEEEAGKLDPRHTRATLRALTSRIEAVLTDPRYSFLFSRLVEDTIEPVLGEVFRIPHDDKPITVFQMAGLPGEVANAISSLLARTAFDLAMWSGGAFEVLLMCEEAHRYIPADQRLGFLPTRLAIARIAKEGRKYGAYVGVISQRPGEIDPSILSQCSTVFAMRLGNDRDQEIVRSAIAETSARMVTLLSSIGDREAIAFGQAVATPMRMRFADQSVQELPLAPVRRHEHLGPDAAIGELRHMVTRMRGALRR
jgi:DNA helicase HerA-like ATPase